MFITPTHPIFLVLVFSLSLKHFMHSLTDGYAIKQILKPKFMLIQKRAHLTCIISPYRSALSIFPRLIIHEFHIHTHPAFNISPDICKKKVCHANGYEYYLFIQILTIFQYWEMNVYSTHNVQCKKSCVFLILCWDVVAALYTYIYIYMCLRYNWKMLGNSYEFSSYTTYAINRHRSSSHIICELLYPTNLYGSNLNA